MISEKEYPQMGTSFYGENQMVELLGPTAYKRGENVPFIKPERVLSWKLDGQALDLELECGQ